MNLPVHSWYGEDYRCNLYQTENRFEYEMIDNRKNEPKRFPIPLLPGTSLNKQLEFLQTYFQCFRKKDNGLILNICTNVYSKEIDDYQITLYKVEESLIWKIFNRVTGQRKEQFLENTLVYDHGRNCYDRYCDERFSAKSKSDDDDTTPWYKDVIWYIKNSEIRVNFLPEIRLENRPIQTWNLKYYWVSLFQDNEQFKVVGYGIGMRRQIAGAPQATMDFYRNALCNIENLDRIQGFGKIEFFQHYQCYLDGTKHINLDKWAITLVIVGPSSQSSISAADKVADAVGHAEIFIEGVDRYCNYFQLYSDLTTKQGIRLEDVTNKYYKVKNKSKTWIRDRKYVEHMLRVISDQKKNPPKLSVSSSVFMNKFKEIISLGMAEPTQNCVMWNRSMLKYANIYIISPLTMPIRWQAGSASDHIFEKIRGLFMNIPMKYIELNSHAFRMILKKEILSSIQLISENKEISDAEKTEQLAFIMRDLIRIGKLKRAKEIIKLIPSQHSEVLLPIIEDLHKAQRVRIKRKIALEGTGFVENNWNFSKLKLK